MKTQLDEAKGIEEVLKNQLDEKEMRCQKLEMEVVEFRKKGEKSDAYVKLKNNSVILDEIWTVKDIFLIKTREKKYPRGDYPGTYKIIRKK